MELIKKNIHMEREKGQAFTQITLEDDINIPDNKPDASKIVLDKGDIKLQEIKPGVNCVTIRGELSFAALYISADTRYGAVGVNGIIPFEEQIHLEGIQGTDQITVRPVIEDLSAGLINSRKMSVRSLIALSVSSEELYDEEVAVDVRENDSIECEKKTLDFASIAVRKKDIFRVREEVELPQNLPNVASVIWSSVHVGDIEFKPLNDKISLQGELKAFFLYEGDGEDRPVRWHETVQPFSGAIDCYGAKDTLIHEIEGVVTHNEIEVRPDFDGEERVLGIDIALDLDIKLYEEDSVDILSDVYGTDKEVIPVTKNSDYRSLVIKNAGKSKAVERFKIKDADSGVLQLCHDEGETIIDNVRVVENGVEVDGTVNVKVLYVTSNDTRPFNSVKGAIPFNMILESPGIMPNSEVKAIPSVPQLSVSLVDSEEVEVKAVVGVKVIVFAKHQIDIISDLKTEPLNTERINALPGIAVHMAKDGDSLWQIGKRYYVPVSSIRDVNELTSDTINAGDKLVVIRGAR